MKLKLILILFGCLLLRAVLAQSPFNISGQTGTTSAEILVPGDPGGRTLITGVVATSDKAASVLKLSSGAINSAVVYATNSLTASNVYVLDNSNMQSNDIVLLQTAAGKMYSATVWGTNNATNVILTSTTFSSATNGDMIFRMGTPITLKCGAATVNYQTGPYLVATRGFPIRVLLDGTSACSIDCLTVRSQ